jgi:hypothetical protein
MEDDKIKEEKEKSETNEKVENNELYLVYDKKNGKVKIYENENLKKEHLIKKKYNIINSIIYQKQPHYLFYNSKNGDYLFFNISKKFNLKFLLENTAEYKCKTSLFSINEKIYCFFNQDEKGKCKMVHLDINNEQIHLIEVKHWNKGWTIVKSFQHKNELRYLTYNKSNL